ncbi:MAG: DUF6624 domain-containing protein [Acidobacteriota bacterium]
MHQALRDELVAMEALDQPVRQALADEGALFNGYHPRMAAVHRDNAARLRAIIAAHGWPGLSLVGDTGAAAAWRIAQHAIGEPAFMRQCRDLIERASAQRDVPRAHFACIDDRIRSFEGRPQQFGTQLRGGAHGLEPYPLVDERRVEMWRRDAGLPPLAEILASANAHPPPKPQDPAASEDAERRWRFQVGWLTSP